MRKLLLYLLILLLPLAMRAQEITVEGIVSDSLGNALERANIIAKPFNDKAELKFAISDHLGRYRLVLENAVQYEVSVSYIGYSDAVIMIEPDTKIRAYNFRLNPLSQSLQEVVINYDYKPVIVKKDTLIYDIAAFAKGNERKMKEVLQKLPGVEVDKDGNVTVQGKRVTTMMVEGKTFFGGGSKLAVDNIPADALDKIEVIDNYNETGFLKNVSDSKDLAMNVKLKEDKKNFIFGDITAGLSVADDEGYHLAHGAAFYYSPKTSLNFIGDANNIGKSTFTFDDMSRFQGGVSNYISRQKTFDNLYSFTIDNQQAVQNKSQFTALSYRQEINDKLEVDSYGIFSKFFISNFSVTKNQYLQNEGFVTEYKTETNDNTTLLGIGSIKLNYTPGKYQKVYYNAWLQAGNYNVDNIINSERDTITSIFNTVNTADNIVFKQYAEWHKQYSNSNHTTTFAVNNSFYRNSPQNTWQTDTEFFPGLIPLQADSLYTIRQVKEFNNNNTNIFLKHYWVLNNANHIFTSVGADTENSKLRISENQLLTNNLINNFSANGFGNDLNYRLSDIFTGLEYKFRIGKWINRPGIYLYRYYLKTEQIQQSNTINKTLLEPQWYSEYEFNSAELLKFTYKLTNSFPDAAQLSERFTLWGYNTVYKGNALLGNERFHSANINYTKTSMYRNLMIYAGSNYTKKVRTIRNIVNVDDINNFLTPIITDNPETTLRVSGTIEKKIYRFKALLRTNLNWFNYTQILNNVANINERNSQNIGAGIRTAYKKWPVVSISYDKGFNQFKGITKSEFSTDAISIDMNIDFFKNFTFTTDYYVVFNNNSITGNSDFTVTNASLLYHKDNNPFTFELIAQNYLNNRRIINNSFSDFIISNQSVHILPRIVMLSISYKL